MSGTTWIFAPTAPGAARLRIDTAARRVDVDGVEVALTPTEYLILICLAERPGTVIKTHDITERVWGTWYGPVDHIFVHIHHLRRKLGPCAELVVTKRTVGYMLQATLIDAEESWSWPPLSAEYFQLLQVDASSRGIAWLIVTERAAVSWASDTVASLFGWWPEDLVGKVPGDLVHMEDEEHLVDRRPPGEAGKAHDARVRLRRADGSMEPVAVMSTGLHRSNGQRVGGIGEWRPLHLADDGVPRKVPAGLSLPFRLRFDGDHRLVSVEPRQEFLGWEPDEVVGTHFSLSGRDDGSSRRVLAAMQASGRLEAGFPFLARCRDGMALGVHTVVRLHRSEGEVTGFTAEVRMLPA